jgi:hypothetical protein
MKLINEIEKIKLSDIIYGETNMKNQGKGKGKGEET